MINTVILDIGQVLADFRWRDYIGSLGFSGEVRKKVAQATVENKAHWLLQDKGVFTDEEYLQECMKLVPGIEEELKLFFERIEGIVVEFAYAEEFVRALKEAGMKVYLLSNYGATTFEYARKNFRFVPLVDGMVISAHVREVKPEEEIYRILLHKYDIVPEQAVFFDDLQANIDTANRLGIRGIRFESLLQAVSELQKLNVPVRTEVLEKYFG